MPGTEKDTKAECSCGTCSCRDTSLDVGGKKYCSAACADGTHTDFCPCGHPDCSPK